MSRFLKSITNLWRKFNRFLWSYEGFSRIFQYIFFFILTEFQNFLGRFVLTRLGKVNFPFDCVSYKTIFTYECDKIHTCWSYFQFQILYWSLQFVCNPLDKLLEIDCVASDNTALRKTTDSDRLQCIIFSLHFFHKVTYEQIFGWTFAAER